MINNDIAHSEIIYKYFFKSFYNRINKKKYNSEIRQYNVHHTNIIAIKDIVVVVERVRKIKKQPAIENILNKIIMAEVTKISNVIDLGSKYSWAISIVDINIVRNLRLTSIKKYWRYANQI